MKKIILFAFLLCSIGQNSAFAQIQTPAASPFCTMSQKVGLANMTIEYSRPSRKGRNIFGDLVPYDKVWRTGANKITVIKFDQDVKIEGQPLAAGSYGWYSFPAPEKWTIALSKDDKQWGAYEYKQEMDALRFGVMREKTPADVEQLTIGFESISPTACYVVLSWERTSIRFKVEHDPHQRILEEIKDKTSQPNCSADTYFDAADYYYEKNLNLEQALIWADKVVEQQKEYWTYQLRARILAKLNRCEDAVKDAMISREMAQKAGDQSYVKKNDAILAQCKK